MTAEGYGVRALGMIWNDQIFPGRAPSGMRLNTCFYGGEKDVEANDLTDEQLRAQVIHDMGLALRMTPGKAPSLLEITRWERALPIFAVGQMAKLLPLMNSLPKGIHLLANYQGGISIPDRVAKARELAETL